MSISRTLDGVTFRSMEDPESVLAVTFPFPLQCLLRLTRTLEDFALLEASYAIVRLIQKYPYLEVPDGDSGAAIGDEKQALALVMTSGEGCWMTMKS